MQAPRVHVSSLAFAARPLHQERRAAGRVHLSSRTRVVGSPTPHPAHQGATTAGGVITPHHPASSSPRRALAANSAGTRSSAAPPPPILCRSLPCPASLLSRCRRLPQAPPPGPRRPPSARSGSPPPPRAARSAARASRPPCVRGRYRARRGWRREGRGTRGRPWERSRLRSHHWGAWRARSGNCCAPHTTTPIPRPRPPPPSTLYAPGERTHQHPLLASSTPAPPPPSRPPKPT